MKKQIIAIIFFAFLISCETQEYKDMPEIQEMFQIKGNVKEIQTISIVLTTMGERKFRKKTTFDKTGEPVETIIYDENGNIESRDPWIKVAENEFKEDEGNELIEKFDAKKRLIKSTKYKNGEIVFEHHYKYDENGNKIEVLEKIKQVKTIFKYLNNNLSEEISFRKEEGGQFHRFRQKVFEYDSKSNLIKMIQYDCYYPDVKKQIAEYNYKYDDKGSLIEMLLYGEHGISEKTIRKIIYY